MGPPRRFVAVLAALVLPFAAAFSFVAPRPVVRPDGPTRQAAPPTVPVRGVVAVAATVADLDRAVAWYVDVLGCARVGAREDAGPAVERRYGVFPARVRSATLRLGDERFELEQFLAPTGRPRPADVRASDAAFQHAAIVVRDMTAAYARLRAAKVAHHSSGPQRIPASNPAAGGVEAFYFRDLDGHPLELLAFPPDKGDARWRAPSTRVFLGVDHTAISVRGTAAALAFYGDVLGFVVAGRSENFGIEQERLNAIRGTRVAITGLRAGSGCGVELLDALAPDEGRPADPTTAACDLVFRRTVLAVDDVDAAAESLRALGVPFVSDGVADATTPEGTRVRSLIVRDPDGHAIELRSPTPARNAGAASGIEDAR